MTNRRVQTARLLRQKQTPTEAMLWRRLRAGQLCGFKFRRQHPTGRFIVDLCCEESGVVVEVDGDTHVGREEHDAARSQWLASEGYVVLRVTNPEVRDNMEGVLEYILMECQKRAGQRWIR